MNTLMPQPQFQRTGFRCVILHNVVVVEPNAGLHYKREDSLPGTVEPAVVEELAMDAQSLLRYGASSSRDNVMIG